ncbi:MAG: hypothetical protein NT036_02160 [Candidatus Omnitrophica bacterium]|nr:hypothetical protein [Candidatus Omnitrophota bacterium]
MFKKNICITVTALLLTAFTPISYSAAMNSSPDDLIIADFNTGSLDKGLSSNAVGCKGSFDSANRHGDAGFAMKLKYSVDSKTPAYNEYRIALPNLDASKYNSVSFWVKGNPKEGHTTIFKVMLENAAGQIGHYYVTNVSDQWQEAVMPLSEFKGITDLSNLTSLVIVFEDKIVSDKTGAIYIDDIRFTGKKR